MRIELNGEETQLPDGTCLADIVADLVRDASATAVACNGEVVPRSAWASTVVRAGDRVEVVSAAPGG